MTDKIDLNLENGEAETTPARKPWVRPVVQRIDSETTDNTTFVILSFDGGSYDAPGS